MSQDASNQPPQSAEEEKNEHFFIRYVQNKSRNLNKKLKQIESLEKQETLNEDQQKKVDNKNEVLEQIAHYKSMLAAYQNAEQEYGVKRNSGKTQKKQAKLEKFRQEEQIVIDSISFMMDLQYLSQYFTKHSQLPQDLQQYSEQINSIKQLHERCFRLSAGKKQKLVEKLEQAKNIMVSVMYQEKEWKGITQNVKMLIKKDCVCQSSVGGKEKKPSRKVSSAVQRKMSNKQTETKYEEKKAEKAEKIEKVEKAEKAEKPHPQQQEKQEQPEDKPTDKKYVLTKVDPQEKELTRNRSKSNKEKPKENQNNNETQKPPRKVTFDETNIKQEKKDEFIEVKNRSQKKQENHKQPYQRKFNKNRGQPQQQQQEFNKKKDMPKQQAFPKKTQQIIQYVKKEQPEEKKQE